MGSSLCVNSDDLIQLKSLLSTEHAVFGCMWMNHSALKTLQLHTADVPLKLVGWIRFPAGSCWRFEKRYLLSVQPRVNRWVQGKVHEQCCHWVVVTLQKEYRQWVLLLTKLKDLICPTWQVWCLTISAKYIAIHWSWNEPRRKLQFLSTLKNLHSQHISPTCYIT